MFMTKEMFLFPYMYIIKVHVHVFFLHVKTNFREISGLFNVENVFVLKAQAELLCKEIAKLCT